MAVDKNAFAEQDMSVEDHEKKRARRVIRIIEMFRGNEAAEYWAWNMTPMPMGLPSTKQLWAGVLFAIGLDRIAHRLAGD